MAGRPTEYDDGRVPLTFYVNHKDAKASESDRDAGHFTRRMARAYKFLYCGVSKADRLQKELERLEEELAQKQAEVATIRQQLAEEEKAAVKTRAVEEMEEEFRKRVRAALAQRIDLSKWMHKKRQDVQIIGWKRSVEIFEEETGRKFIQTPEDPKAPIRADPEGIPDA